MSVTFTASGAEKIRRAVRKVLGTPDDRTGDRTPVSVTERSFWAMLLTADVTGLRWTFLRVVPTTSTDEADFVLAREIAYRIADVDRTEGYARESNGTRDIPTFTVVRVEFVGYDADSLPSYLFQWVGPRDAGYLPPHDHRDNFNGGFAFASYHPGTALPQQPWHS
jgi:hypothetical protein